MSKEQKKEGRHGFEGILRHQGLLLKMKAPGAALNPTPYPQISPATETAPRGNAEAAEGLLPPTPPPQSGSALLDTVASSCTGLGMTEALTYFW